MDDKELLELAAKAAGVNLSGGVDEHGAYEENWNPLDNDGDALRLAVKLGIWMTPINEQGEFSATVPTPIAPHPLRFTERLAFGSADTAMRRAIVRAAAAIGQSR